MAASPDPAYSIRSFPSARASEAPPGLLRTPAGDKPALDRCRVAASPDPAYSIPSFPSVRASEAPPGLLRTPRGR
ncbi:hypothetical protein EOL18_10755 [Raoultella ornithinolytica]|uniref:hypothetical protein n=1 Tax=Raoultella ornithinolytica TaxID=54291 RepID=UPI0004DAEECF|nr:hypothetical protein [Raoultella ornithinolytica]KDX14942.1 hypothetical protein AB28_1018 [Raoultella ornithinolytica 2-156-04_S1_C2]RVS18557.1 hypothetical protein EOL18_10755 [Raoultella ornithinolytica]